MNSKLVLIGLLLFLFSTQVYALSDANLIAWYKFDETSGTTAFDAKNTSNGIITNAVVNQVGKIGKAYSFDGNTDYVNTNSTFGFNGTKAITINAWVNTSTNRIFDGVIGSRGTASQWSGISLYDSNNAQSSIDGSVGQGNCAFTNNTVPRNSWVMVTTTYDGTTIKNYINGNLSSSCAYNGNQIVASNFFIGVDSYSYSTRNFTGKIDEVSLWKRPLPVEDILELYNSGIGITYPFDETSFSYLVNPEEEKVYLYDTSDIGEGITDWNWLVDGLSISTDQNTSFIATEFTDYNVCLIINDGNFSTCETINSGEFYGEINFTIYDENSSSLLNNSTISVTPDINEVSNWILTDTNTLAIDLTGITTGTYTFALTKTGYSTRYYTTDLNQYSKLDINFALLPESLSKEVQFRFYKPDQITSYNNIYVTAAKSPQSFVLSRLKTDATGLVTFNLDQNATGITFDMNNGENTYYAVVLNINRPKDEQTLTDINSNWGLEISGLANYLDANISGNTKTFAIYSNTVNNYTAFVNSLSTTPTYTTRKYDIQVFGDINAYTLQPYLINTTNAVPTTIYTINPYTNQSVSDVTIKVYRTLPLLGKTLIEQTITDSKGQSLLNLILNQTYSFEISVGTTSIRTESYSITGTSQVIYFKIDPGYNLNTQLTTPSTFSYWTPGKSSLSKSDSNISANVVYGTNKNSVIVTNIIINCYNNSKDLNSVLLFQDSFNNPTLNFVQTYDFNLTTKTINSASFDSNYSITCNIYTTLSDGNLIVSRQTYTMNNDDPQTNLGMDLRPFFGCSSTTDPNLPCPLMILAAVFITMMVITGIMIESGFTQPEFAGILFLIGLGFFTFFTWIPPVLYVIMLVIGLLIYVALGVRRI